MIAKGAAFIAAIKSVGGERRRRRVNQHRRVNRRRVVFRIVVARFDAGIGGAAGSAD